MTLKCQPSDLPMLPIPVVDLTEREPLILEKIQDACRHWGFFQVIGHRIDPEKRRRFFHQIRRFFEMPAVDKRHLERTRDNPWGFYDQELTKNIRDWKEIYDFGRPQADHPSRPQWPRALPEFQPTMMAWFEACEHISHRLVSLLSQSLGLDSSALASHFESGHSSFLRLNFYPPCDHPAAASVGDEPVNGHLGINRHTDAGALTVLVQDEVQSLQVRHQDRWHTVNPMEDALIINIGDLFQVWSNDEYRAPEHRVLANQSHPRFSAPFFYNPAVETNVQPLTGTTPHYRPVNWAEFRDARALGDYGDFGREIQISDYRV
jgi:isopenicillin N synthase-like dioxygenase